MLTMAAKKKTTPKKGNVNIFYITSTSVMDIQVESEFSKDLSIMPRIEGGLPVFRLTAAPGTGKICLRIPPKVGESAVDDCASRELNLRIDEKTPDPWRVSFGRGKKARQRK
jgi:hypothetical protein